MSSLIVEGSLTGFVACPHLFSNELSVGILEIISPALGWPAYETEEVIKLDKIIALKPEIFFDLYNFFYEWLFS